MIALGTILMIIGIMAAPLVGFVYPDWKAKNGEELSEWQLYGIRALGIGILLAMYALAQLIA